LHLVERHARASALLAAARDVIDLRPEGPDAPPWCNARGWRPYLAGLDDRAVVQAEREGLAAVIDTHPDAPADLVAMAREVAAVTALPWLGGAQGRVVDRRRASPRKQAQVAAFEALAARVAVGRERVVDVGSGHGHLTRHLAEALDVRAEGWERDPARVAVASSLARDDRARFVVAEASSLSATLRASDLVVGLHACGALGDLAVQAAAQAGAALALVGCCLQKRSAAREPLAVAVGITPESLTLDRRVLGLGNARDGDEGVEDDLATRTRSRVQRRALAAVFGAVGHAVDAGEEMRGVNRRRAMGDFAALVALAFAAHGVDAPPLAVTRAALAAAQADYAHERRWALPRAMLARLVEVWVALDRAVHLQQRGYEATVGVAFDAAESPRNVAVVAG
jgi:SAM-dependent methyltransferase